MTDPEELRTRAASIFERLRKGGGPSGIPPETTEGGAESNLAPNRVEDTAVEQQGSDGLDPSSEVETLARDAGAADGGTIANRGPRPDIRTTEPAGESATGSTSDAATAATADQVTIPPVATAIAPADTALSPVGTALPGTALADTTLADTTLAGTALADATLADATLAGDSDGLGGAVDSVQAPAGSLPGPGMAARLLPDIGAGAERDPGWRAARPLPRILAIANQKGGVGKTTTAVNLGAALAELAYRVLVIDLDPQGNATTGLGINARNLDASVYDVLLHDTPIEDCIEPTSLRNLFVVPATIDLAGAEIELVPVFSRELRLRRALERITDDFDFVLIDCPPSLGLLTVNGLAAATEVVVPIQCEYYALEGLGQLLRNVNLVKSNLNAGLEVTTIILTMFDARTRLAEQVVAEVRSHFGDRVCRNVVPRTVRLSEAPSFGQPIIVFDSSSRGAIAYRELAKEVSGGAPQRVG